MKIEWVVLLFGFVFLFLTKEVLGVPQVASNKIGQSHSVGEACGDTQKVRLWQKGVCVWGEGF